MASAGSPSSEMRRAAWLRLESKGLDQLLDLGEKLSDAQVTKFMDALWKELGL